ncbi:hypothetical protein COL26b_013390 [Colletotrichum chrysophilum]|uniref:uncharacterized protein n=1 Tax=Colletotrichum chrysophilum TaxID=1836956 RepID=UPI0023006CB7|nr:uncharacterized protein COL26b_013390 [Colletotrichum chrysophilum]KAJ0362313.1 hypothetical protein COL26b_013390 [Colletotrichum chrysophilum]
MATLHTGVCSVFEKHLDNLSMGSITRSIESSAVLASMCVNFCPILEKQLDDFSIASEGSGVESVAMKAALSVDVCSFSEKKPYHLLIAVFSCSLKSVPGLAALSLDVRSFFKQKPCDVLMAISDGSLKSVAILTALDVDICSFFKNKPHNLLIASRRGSLEGGAVFAALYVDVGSFLEKLCHLLMSPREGSLESVAVVDPSLIDENFIPFLLDHAPIAKAGKLRKRVKLEVRLSAAMQSSPGEDRLQLLASLYDQFRTVFEERMEAFQVLEPPPPKSLGPVGHKLFKKMREHDPVLYVMGFPAVMRTVDREVDRSKSFPTAMSQTLSDLHVLAVCLQETANHYLSVSDWEQYSRTAGSIASERVGKSRPLLGLVESSIGTMVENGEYTAYAEKGYEAF